MTEDVIPDQLAIIRVAGMHSHQCELTIQRTLGREEGVYEVEVDFLSGQASVLFDPTRVRIPDLLTAIETAGYDAGPVTQGGATDAATD